MYLSTCTIIIFSLFKIIFGHPSNAHVAGAAQTSPIPPQHYSIPHCWDPTHPPPEIRNPGPPLKEDVNIVVNLFKEEDTRRPPEISSWGDRLVYDETQVDFPLPITAEYRAAKGAFGMREDQAATAIAYAYMYVLAEALEYIRHYCEPRGNLGGVVGVGDQLVVLLLGYATADDRVAGVENETFVDALPRLFKDLEKTSLVPDPGDGVKRHINVG